MKKEFKLKVKNVQKFGNYYNFRIYDLSCNQYSSYKDRTRDEYLYLRKCVRDINARVIKTNCGVCKDLGSCLNHNIK